MTNEELAFAPVHVLAAEMAAGKLTSTKLTEACLARIKIHGEKLHAFVTVYADEALHAAHAADEAIASGHRIGPFHGIPVVLKDIIDLKGRITTGGSKVWEKRVSTRTATLAKKLISAGMIVLGKTHSVEFAMGSFGTNTHMGTPWNPWNMKELRGPGGSSSGTGVSVAAGLAPWGIGTDTGGSVRIPASWCGLAGLKTTIGRISVHGVLPLSHTLDTPGPMCRSVEDAALLYNLLQGPDPFDPLTQRHAPDDPMATLKRGVAGLVLARLPAGERANVEAEVLSAYDASLAVLEQLGAKLVDVALPRTFADLGAMAGRLIGCEGYSYVGTLTDDPAQPVDPDVRPRIGLGKGVSARDYLLLLREREQLKRDWSKALAGCDALLTPTTLTAAPRVADIDQSGTAAVATRPINLVDGCALAVRNGFTKSGLPTSLQIACRGHDEAAALRVGWAYEQAAGFKDASPPLPA
ncbi:MAG: amidase [Betaproteobacteria bacterium]|nr:amidase [Betaproteobacteria bacterium]